MTRKEIKEEIRQRMEARLPDVLGKAKADERVFSPLPAEPVRRPHFALKLASAAAAFMVCLLAAALLLLPSRPAAVVALDMDETICLGVDRDLKVTSVKVYGEGEPTLRAVNFEDKDIEEVISLLVLQSMSKNENKYFDEVGTQSYDSVLMVSVQSEDKAFEAELNDLLNQNETVSNLSFGASLAVVVEKDFDSGAEASQEAESYGVSPAKLDLMKEVQRKHPGLTLEELSDWSCGKLFAALEEEV